MVGSFNRFHVYTYNMHRAAWEAGAHTFPLLTSTSAVSDTKCTLNIPEYPPTPPKHPLNNA